MATTTKLPTGTQIKGVNCPMTGKPLYVAPATGGGIRIGRVGTKGSTVLDDVVMLEMLLQRIPKSDRRVVRKALAKAGRTDLAATRCYAARTGNYTVS